MARAVIFHIFSGQKLVISSQNQLPLAASAQFRQVLKQCPRPPDLPDAEGKLLPPSRQQQLADEAVLADAKKAAGPWMWSCLR